MRILVVDDGCSVEWVSRILRRWGHEVWVATSRESALDAVSSSEEHELAVLDLHMPGVLAVVPVLRARGCRIVGLAATRIERELLDTVTLQRPFSSKDLLSALHDALDSAA